MRDSKCYAIKIYAASLTGFEPAIFPLGGGCVIHCATETRTIYTYSGISVTQKNIFAATRDRTGDLQIFSLTLSQLSYSGTADTIRNIFFATAKNVTRINAAVEK